MKTKKKNKKILIDKANGIHNHIAYLFADPKWIIKDKNINFSLLILSDNEIQVLSISKND